MPAPIIGLTTFRQPKDQDHYLISINESYVKAVSATGAVPLLIPLGLPGEHLDIMIGRLDGIIFTGGGDMLPEQYGSQPHPKVDGVDTDRDRVEMHLAQCAISAGLPMLGICRGLQVINVALGGTLYEDIPDQRAGALQHQFDAGWPRNHLAHPVNIEPGSRLARILGEHEILVNSLHHQGIRDLAPAAAAVAYAPDGLIEAIELRSHPYGLAVQWHPEELTEHASMRAIFADFVRAAARPRPSKF